MIYQLSVITDIFSPVTDFLGSFEQFVTNILSNIWGLITQLLETFANAIALVLPMTTILPILNGFFPTVLSTSIYIFLIISIVKLVGIGHTQ